MIYYDLKTLIKRYRWMLRRMQAAKIWGKDVLNAQPIVVMNAIPKSGSHLLTQVIDGIIEISPLVDSGMPPLNRAEKNIKLGSYEKIQNRIHSLKAGDFSYGYLNANKNYVPLLSNEKFSVLFIYRDPRDVVVSQVQYATYMKKNHHMHDFYQQLDSDEERLNAAICGVATDGYKISSILKRYENYQGWLDCSTTFPVKFEDLILNRDEAFREILRFLQGRGLTISISEDEAVKKMNEAVQPKKSGTFRKGQPGSWKEQFSEENKRIFKEQTGNLLIRLGYEDSMDW